MGDARHGIRAVALDAYGTLLAITSPQPDPYRAVLRDLALPQSALRAAARLAVTTNLSLAEFAARFAPARTLDLPLLEEALRQQIESVRLYPDVLPTLARLRAAGLGLAIVSNLASPYVDPLVRLLGEQVDHVVLSCEVGARKPERLIFEEACRRLGCSAGEVLMVGDGWESDIKGARSAGLSALWCRRDSVAGDVVDLRGVLRWLAIGEE